MTFNNEKLKSTKKFVVSSGFRTRFLRIVQLLSHRIFQKSVLKCHKGSQALSTLKTRPFCGLSELKIELGELF